LAGGPGMLVIGGCNIDVDTFDALGDAAGDIVEHDGSDSNLMAIVIANLVVAVGDRALGLIETEMDSVLRPGFGAIGYTRERSNSSANGAASGSSGREAPSPRKTIYLVRRRLI